MAFSVTFVFKNTLQCIHFKRLNGENARGCQPDVCGDINAYLDGACLMSRCSRSSTSSSTNGHCTKLPNLNIIFTLTILFDDNKLPLLLALVQSFSTALVILQKGRSEVW